MPVAPAVVARSRGLFIAAIALSAVSMFSLELLAGQLVLPAFGGAPGVWATALCFFTAVLFLGYLYAHVLVTRLGRRTAGLIHVGLAVIALALTIAAPADVASLRIPGLAEAPNVLLTLVVIAGAPAFLFSATTPLLSSWYGRGGADPWWLYAASNAASLLGVLAYPFLIQPFIPLSAQRLLLIVAVAAFAALLVAIVVRIRRGDAADTAPAATTAGTRIARWRQAKWLAAAFVPAGLLSATTNQITTDLVSAPFLWIWPLAIYLGSFVVAFSDVGRRRVLPIVDRLIPAAATLLWIPTLVATSWPVLVVLLVQLTSFSVLAVAVHGRLALDRPDEPNLTRFYLVISAGGVLATAFVALVAPQIFSSITEYPMLIVAAIGALAILAGPALSAPRAGIRGVAVDAGVRLAPYVLFGGLLVLLTLSHTEFIGEIVLLVAVGAVLVAIAQRLAVFAVASAGAIVVLSVVLSTGALLEHRSFFGVIRVLSENDGVARAEYSGTTQHGIQFIDARQFQATSYYVQSGPLGDAFADLWERTTAASVGVVGLGTGTIAVYERPTDSMTFFEIDQTVVDIARDTRWFSYLSSAPVAPSVVVGDARLSLQDVPERSFDLLVLDAFSSDAVPVHLLTTEALAIYRRVMRPDGVMLFHVSNRYYDLAPAIVSTAESMGLAGRQLAYLPGPARTAQLAASGSDWVVVGAPTDVQRFAARAWGVPRGGPVLTDDFSDLLRLLLMGQ